MNERSNTELPKRYLSQLDTWAMAFGCMVGWGTFVMPGTTFLPVAGPFGTMLAIFTGMIIMLVIGYNFAFLMKRNPGTGGLYAYTKEAFGRDHAFLCSWFLCLSYLTIVFLNGTALFIVLRTMFGDYTQVGFYYSVSGIVIYIREIMASVTALVGVGVLFITTRSVLHRIHTVLSVILVLGIFITAAVCIPHAKEIIGAFGSRNTNPGLRCVQHCFSCAMGICGF